MRLQDSTRHPGALASGRGGFRSRTSLAEGRSGEQREKVQQGALQNGSFISLQGLRDGVGGPVSRPRARRRQGRELEGTEQQGHRPVCHGHRLQLHPMENSIITTRPVLVLKDQKGLARGASGGACVRSPYLHKRADGFCATGNVVLATVELQEARQCWELGLAFATVSEASGHRAMTSVAVSRRRSAPQLGVADFCNGDSDCSCRK
ncbi:hypothetical protein IWX50DRAFT_612386 [Phyllosticta citricarpa]|uniref:Uncharacterized protein n=1 Tax=Phyllosticta citricarpa TaxID=55181 RepID=A0ABR1MM83_9PEZI